MFPPAGPPTCRYIAVDKVQLTSDYNAMDLIQGCAMALNGTDGNVLLLSLKGWLIGCAGGKSARLQYIGRGVVMGKDKIPGMWLSSCSLMYYFSVWPVCISQKSH